MAGAQTKHFQEGGETRAQALNAVIEHLQIHLLKCVKTCGGVGMLTAGIVVEMERHPTERPHFFFLGTSSLL